MKLDKRTLKGIVKECLIEILAEGIVSQGSRQSSLKKKTLKDLKVKLLGDLFFLYRL